MSFTISGCNLFVSNTGKKALQEGKLALASGNFNSALGYFELAQNEGNNSNEVKNLISTINNYLTALDSCNNGDFEHAQKVVETIVLIDDTKTMSKYVDKLKDDIQDGLDERAKIDEKIEEIEKLFAIGDYAGVNVNIRELENNEELSDKQKNKIALLKQQWETANGKVASASKTNVVYISDYDKENAKNAVKNFVYAYEAFVKSGNRSSSSYYSYMATYSPSWSNAYKNQWNYFSKHRITSYYIESLLFGSVTFDGNYFYVVDTEAISETKDGNFVRSMERWKYTVVKDGNVFKVTNYAKAK